MPDNIPNYFSQSYATQRMLNIMKGGAKASSSVNSGHSKGLKKDTVEISGCTDGKDDGKISFKEKVVNFAKGAVAPITNMFKSPKNFLISAAAIAGTTALIIGTGGAAAPFLIAAGAIGGGIQLGVNAYKASKATTDAEAKQAWQGIGSGTTTLVASAAGAKSALKATNVDTSKMGFVKATIECIKQAPQSLKNSIETVKTGAFLANLKTALHIKPSVKNEGETVKPESAEPKPAPEGKAAPAEASKPAPAPEGKAAPTEAPKPAPAPEGQAAPAEAPKPAPAAQLNIKEQFELMKALKNEAGITDSATLKNLTQRAMDIKRQNPSLQLSEIKDMLIAQHEISAPPKPVPAAEAPKPAPVPEGQAVPAEAPKPAPVPEAQPTPVEAARLTRKEIKQLTRALKEENGTTDKDALTKLVQRAMELKKDDPSASFETIKSDILVQDRIGREVSAIMEAQAAEVPKPIVPVHEGQPAPVVEAGTEVSTLLENSAKIQAIGEQGAKIAGTAGEGLKEMTATLLTENKQQLSEIQRILAGIQEGSPDANSILGDILKE